MTFFQIYFTIQAENQFFAFFQADGSYVIHVYFLTFFLNMMECAAEWQIGFI